MKETLRFLSVLLIICVVSAACVGALFYLLAGRIERNRQTVKGKAIRFVLPGAVKFDDQKYPGDPEDEDDDIIIGMDESGAIVGYTTIGMAKGYASDIEVFVGVRPDLKKIIAVRILSQGETPGLGAKIDEVKSDETIWSAIAGMFSKGPGAGKRKPSIEEPWFQKQFKGKTLEQLEVVKRKNPERIQAITAATISSKATTEAARRAMEKIIQEVGKEKGGAEGGD